MAGIIEIYIPMQLVAPSTVTYLVDIRNQLARSP